MTQHRTRKRTRGVALLLALWVTALLATLLLGVAAAARSHAESALYGSEHVRAELAAEAGLAHAVAGLRSGNAAQRWVPDGRPYDFAFDGTKVRVSVVDVSGMVDLNAAPDGLLRGMFMAAGADAARADDLAAQVVALRSGSGRRLAQPFRSIDELARVPGMDAALFERVAAAVTVQARRNLPDASYAGPLALAALRGIGTAQAATLVHARWREPAQRGAGNGMAVGGVGEGPLVAGYGGMVERVFSVATLPDGTRAGIDATVRFALTGAAARPYIVLAWRADDAPST